MSKKTKCSFSLSFYEALIDQKANQNEDFGFRDSII